MSPVSPSPFSTTTEVRAKLARLGAGEASLIRYFFALLIIVLLGLNACGQTGALYWPAEEAEVEVEVEANDEEVDSKKQDN